MTVTIAGLGAAHGLCELLPYSCRDTVIVYDVVYNLHTRVRDPTFGAEIPRRMLLLYAGRRPGGDFPPENEQFVAEQVRQVLSGLRPRRVIGSAAAGADIVVLEAARRLGIEFDVLLAGSAGEFRSGSVDDKGDDWGVRFDSLLGSALNVIEAPLHATAEDGYRSVTRLIGQRPVGLLAPNEQVVVLVVASAERSGTDHSEELAADAQGARRLVLRIDPRKRLDETPRAFVAMPFGNKPYPDRGWRRFDADLTYHRAMLPALIGAGYQPMRADTDALLEVIDHTMLREINRSDVMLVDLAMLNANVMWELGVRHAWRRSGTILIAPEWVRAPFDIQRVPVNSYTRGARSIPEHEVVRLIRLLDRLLDAAGENRIDSPIFANVDGLTDFELPEPAAEQHDDTAGELLVLITRAADLEDTAELERLATRISAAPLPGGTRDALLEQVGLSLIGLDQHDMALPILTPLADNDVAFERRTLQEQLAHAQIRSDAATHDEALVAQAQARLRAVSDRHGASGETLGLLGSAYKHRVERALQAECAPDLGQWECAINAYRSGLEAEPGDYYPGINVVALLRLRGQFFSDPESPDDLREAMALLPVVEFAVTRNDHASEDPWATLTLAECALHRYLIAGDAGDLERATRQYSIAAADVPPRHHRSATRQLRMMRDAGDPPKVIDPILSLFSDDDAVARSSE